MYLLHVSGSLLYLIVPEYNIFLTATHRSIFSTKCGFRLSTFVLEKNIFALYTVFPPLKPEGLIYFYFGNSDIISEQGSISVVIIS